MLCPYRLIILLSPWIWITRTLLPGDLLMGIYPLYINDLLEVENFVCQCFSDLYLQYNCVVHRSSRNTTDIWRCYNKKTKLFRFQLCGRTLQAALCEPPNKHQHLRVSSYFRKSTACIHILQCLYWYPFRLAGCLLTANVSWTVKIDAFIPGKAEHASS